MPDMYITPTRAHRVPMWFYVTFAVLAVAIGGVLVALSSRPSPTLEPTAVQQSISVQWQVLHGSTPPFVVCPTGQPLKAGWIFDCSIDLVPIPLIVRVTEDDNRGHYHWELTAQPAS
jgi:hypothetical protein